MRLLPIFLLLLACAPDASAPAAPEQAVIAGGAPFPAPSRPVADIRSDSYSDESSRDARGEAATVLRLSAIRPGLTVADIGAGAGYYTLRLASAVGPGGTVIATDIIPDYLNRLRRRVQEKGFRNVALMLGDDDNPRLPPQSIHVALMVHMYHEIQEPYAFLWYLHEALVTQPDGQPPLVAIVDSNRPTNQHGTPPDLLECELKASGYQQMDFRRLSPSTYLALFTPGERPEPQAIIPCEASR